MSGTPLSRRALLRAGGGLAAAGLAGIAAGSTDEVRINVGYDSPAGERAARAAATEVIHEFGFDALTVLAPQAEARALESTPGIRYVERDRRVEAIDRLRGGPGGGGGSVDRSDAARGTRTGGTGDAAAAGDAAASGAAGGSADGSGDSDGGSGGSDGPATTADDPTGTGYLGQVLPWGIDRVDAEVAHANGDTGDGAHVAIIDTGIDRAHLDLRGNVGDGATLIGASFTGAAAPGGQDDNGHGTHVAGTADALDNSRGVVGVSTAATLHPVKVLTAAGVGFTSDVAKGVEYTADQGWDVANMSLGGPASETMKEACQTAYDAGVLLVAAAGNSGPCDDCVGYPAAYDTVVAVSATTRDDSLASFSSTGPEVELAAPGDDVYSSFVGNTYLSLQGTSMASPHVAGAGAQLMANGYDNDDARKRLRNTAEDIGLSKNEQGHGLVDVAAALGYDSSDDLGGSDGGSGGSAPSASIDGVTESESSNPHAEFDVSWSASDGDGDLASAELALVDDTDGGQEDTKSVNVSGSSAGGTTTLRAHKDDGSGNEYTVSLHVRDEAGNADSASASTSENGE